jgi:polyferredoxin
MAQGFLAKLGGAMRDHRQGIVVIRWFFVSLYVFLLLLPLFFPQPDKEMLWLTLFLFWGVGWPLIFISIMLFGRTWCGLCCPDGTLTELISRHGQQKSIPRWMRWPGWPCLMLVLFSLSGQWVAASDLYYGTLLLLGLPTLGALVCGYLYGQGHRIWCMYLCPANASFALLSKVAPLHFQASEEKIRHAPPPFPRVNCPTLINIRQMKSASACHMCAQCNGYLDAVKLASRSPGQEILDYVKDSRRTTEALTLLFGFLGAGSMALLWKGSAWFPAVKRLLTHSPLAFLEHAVALPWLLTNHPGGTSVFTWLDGASMLLFILGGGIVLGSALTVLLLVAARMAKVPALSWQQLSLALIPVGGAGMFLGLTSVTVTLLARRGISYTWLPVAQQTLLALGACFSCWLGMKLLFQRRTARQCLAFLIFLLSVALISGLWLPKLSA